MFLHLSVCHSIHMGCMHGEVVCMAGGHVWWGVCVAGGMFAGVYVLGVYIARDTTTAADSTHPTGMHSCSM